MEQNNETKVTEKTVVSQDTVKSFDPVFDNEIKAALPTIPGRPTDLSWPESSHHRYFRVKTKIKTSEHYIEKLRNTIVSNPNCNSNYFMWIKQIVLDWENDISKVKQSKELDKITYAPAKKNEEKPVFLAETVDLAALAFEKNKTIDILQEKEPLKIKDRWFIARRHFPAAIKEWKNSVYAYNKVTLNHLPSIDIETTSFIKSYFYLTHITNKPRSTRMRSLRRKYTSKKIFSSKPEVKQTSDKVIVTVYTFNRERQFLLKKLFFHNRRAAIYLAWKKTKELDNIHKNTLDLVRLDYIEKSRQFLYFLKQRNDKALFKQFLVRNRVSRRLKLKKPQVWKDFYNSRYFKVIFKYIIKYAFQRYDKTNDSSKLSETLNTQYLITGKYEKIEGSAQSLAKTLKQKRNIIKYSKGYNNIKARALLHSQIAALPGFSTVKTLYPKSLQDFYSNLSEIMRANRKQETGVPTKLTKLILNHNLPKNIVETIMNSPVSLKTEIQRAAYLSLTLKSAFYQSDAYPFFATRSKDNKYFRRYHESFRKRPTPAIKPWYIRKKMRWHIPEPLFVKRKGKSKYTKRKIAYSRIKHKSQMNFLSFKLLLRYKGYAYARKLFYYYFLKYVLSMFKIKFYAFKENDRPSNDYLHKLMVANVLRKTERTIKRRRKGKRNKKSKFIYDINKAEIPYYRPIKTLSTSGDKMSLHFYIIKTKGKTLRNMLSKKTNADNLDFLKKTKPFVICFNLIPNAEAKVNLDYILSNVNYIVGRFLSNIFIRSCAREKDRLLLFILKSYYKRHYFKYISKFWKKDNLFKSTYIRFMVNKFKFNKYLPNLKIFLSKIYNKKIELNIINLKYASLNTDIYTDLIALKLRKRLGLLRVLKRALMLAKRPKAYIDTSIVKNPIELNILLQYSNISLSRFLFEKKDLFSMFGVSDLMSTVYPYPLDTTSFKSEKATRKIPGIRFVTSKLQNVLSKIKYKSIAGVWIKGAGRLTRRYTAARAIHKVKNKGSLRDNDYSRKIELLILNKSPSVVFLRNKAKANSQYSCVTSKRRIGAFGVKTWISGY